MADNVLILYSTPFCSLCEKAKVVIVPVLEATGYTLEEVNIIENELLLNKYQFTIPVIQVKGTDKECGWPFNSKAVLALLCD